MNILIIGQCTLHWGRMEFGNIGNYYIMEPLIRGLHKSFPNSNIRTTFQMSDRFCKDEKVSVLPMELYYGFLESDLETAKKEYEIALEFSKTGKLSELTDYIKAVNESDLIIDFSGDIWGDNADFLGADRFLTGLYKDRTAQLLGKKTAMIAGSPGPFHPSKKLEFAKEIFQNFDLVTNREALSRNVLLKNGFDLTKLKDLSCPAFLFEPKKNLNLESVHPFLKIKRDYRILGVILCGWNFTEGPFDKWPRQDKEYDFLVEPLIEFLNINQNIKLCLMSHSNGFVPGKEPFELIHGRDYPIAKQLQKILEQKGFRDRLFCLDGVYDAWTTKTIIGSFDMLISGRVHAAVAGFSQFVPTVVIDYGHEPKAHKLKGFANEAGMIKMVAEPDRKGDIFNKLSKCYKDLDQIKAELIKNIPTVKEKANQNFELLKQLFK